VHIEIPSCTAIEFVENLQNDKLDEIYVVNENIAVKEVSIDKLIPKLRSNYDIFLDLVNITVPGKECETYNFVVKTPPCLQLVKK
jgi:hypothetical protein